ncbi:MAG TPA: hypothetical protein VM889_10475 [Candidatus Thermoplasmatota archaeon]|nr:hypothetical protein [Candidatus Thermoplasmatota archaeon]
MSLRALPRALAVLAAALLLAPLVANAAPEAATSARVGEVDVAFWIGSEDGATVFVTPNDTHVLRVSFSLAASTNATAANVTARVAVAPPSAVARLENATWNASLVPGAVRDFDALVAIAPGAAGNVTFTLNVTATSIDEDGFAVASVSRDLEYTVEVLAPVPAVPPYSPLMVLSVAGGVVAVAGGGYYLYRRSRRQVRVAPRSRALREARLEEVRPAEQAAIQEQVRAEEAQRTVRRETQILEAKRADLAKSIERLDERRAAGQLTSLQHQKMREKKVAELAEIERQIAEMENGG